RHRRHRRSKRLSPDCLAQMLAYPWPGNVRELENEVERLVVLAGDATTISAALLSPRIRLWMPSPDHEPAIPETGSLPAAIEALERRMIGAAMRRHNGNKTRAAEDLKVSRRNLIRLVQKYQLG
ncbi:MAG: helix-turn-helix domain-containing protein, partial [Kofleriaceae bacterium]